MEIYCMEKFKCKGLKIFAIFRSLIQSDADHVNSQCSSIEAQDAHSQIMLDHMITRFDKLLELYYTKRGTN